MDTILRWTIELAAEKLNMPAAFVFFVIFFVAGYLNFMNEYAISLTRILIIIGIWSAMFVVMWFACGKQLCMTLAHYKAYVDEQGELLVEEVMREIEEEERMKQQKSRRGTWSDRSLNMRSC